MAIKKTSTLIVDYDLHQELKLISKKSDIRIRRLTNEAIRAFVKKETK